MPRASEIHFRLKAAPTEYKSIRLEFKYNKQLLRFYTGQKVKEDQWNPGKERVKSSNATTADGKFSLNEFLDGLQRELSNVYLKSLVNGIPTPDYLHAHLTDYVNRGIDSKKARKNDLYNLIERFIAGEIKSRGLDKSKGTTTNYKSVLLHLKAFEQHEKYAISFDTITLDFFYRYTSFLSKHGNLNKKPSKDSVIGGPMKTNSVAKDIRLLKLFMGEAVDLGYTTNYQFRHKKFSKGGEETDAIYLTEKEIINLYRTDMENEKLENVKDLFVFGSFVGLRFSDFSNVKPENIVIEDGIHLIKMYTQKTKDLVIIPCNPIVLEIFKKYENNANRLPKTVSNQKFNDYIKEVCKKAGLTETGRLIKYPERPLYDCISSHTARRSFATNWYLAGFPTIDLMKITGHKTERAFMKYIKTTKSDTAKRMSALMNANWGKTLYKVAS